jgi:hypothetical protein
VGSSAVQEKLFCHAGTRAEYLGEPSADSPGGMFFGFDLMRQIY